MKYKIESLDLYPTNFCQLHCEECYLNSNEQEWSSVILNTIIDSKIFSVTEQNINILGGEPTEWKFLYDLLFAIRSQNKKVNITITTNAIKLIHDIEHKEKFIKCCVDCGVKVNVSWHYNQNIIKPILDLKKHNILNYVIFVPNN